MNSRLLRVGALLSIFVLATILFQAPQAAAMAPPDADADGLDDAFERGTWYRQTVAVEGLPLAIPNSGADVLLFSLARPLWRGVDTQAFLRVEVDHAAPADLVVAVGFWNGASWDDRLVWVPGGFSGASIWDTAQVAHPHARMSCVSVHIHYPYGYPHCHAYGTTYTTHTHTYASQPAPAATGQRVTLTTSTIPTGSASGSSGSVHRVTVALPFTAAQLQGHAEWRVLARDWNPLGPAGQLRAAELVTEERSDASRADTDGDGSLKDGAEVLIGIFPVAQDTDWDGLTDVFEKDARWLRLVINGATVWRNLKTDPARWDTDGDGLGDGEERGAGQDGAVTDPTVADTDGDGLADGKEVMEHHSNPAHRDTDGDGFTDAQEVTVRYRSIWINGAWRTRAITTLPYAKDSDGDGLTDDEEWYGTSVYGVRTDPSDPDTDGDGLPDGQERYVREFSLPVRKRLGTSQNVYLTASFSGGLEKVEVRYGLSSIAVSNFYLRLYKGSASVLLKNHGGTGEYEFGSRDITDSFGHGGSYRLYISSWRSGGILEEFTLSFTLRTSPVRADSDGDGLTDGEEVTHGRDGWVTDPNRADTDGDGWRDGYESFTAGTSPLARDTDGDGAIDSRDLNPLRNLLVRVYVRQIHQGNPGCTPTLAGVVRINGDHTWVTPHKKATGSAYTSYGCVWWGSTESQRASFYTTYYADVPDDVSTVNVQASAWSTHRWGDDLLVDRSFTYSLNTYRTYTLYGGSHWISLTLSTTSLGKVRTHALTDGEATVQAENGQHRYVAPDRFFFFLVEATSSYGSISKGMHAFLIPRALFLESQLKDRLDRGYTWPLADAKFYGEGTSQGDISEAVTSVTAGKLAGSAAYWLLQYLRRDASGRVVRQAVDVTAYAPLVNLPADALNIIPWVGVANSATGPMPKNFWQKIGAVAGGMVNAVVQTGQLAWGGLIAAGNFFVALGQAISDWGQSALGTVLGALGQVQAAMQKIGQVLTTFAGWVVDFAFTLIKAVLSPILDTIKALLDASIRPIAEDMALAVQGRGTAQTAAVSRIATQIFLLASAFAFIPIAIRGVEITIKAATAGMAWLVTKLMSKTVGEFIVRYLAFTALSMGAGIVLTELLEDLGWLEATTVALVQSVSYPLTLVSIGSAILFKLSGIVYSTYYRGKTTPMKGWFSIGLSLGALLLAVLGPGFSSGPVLAVLEFVSLGLAITGLAGYFVDSRTTIRKAIDIPSDLAIWFEKAVAYVTPALILARIGGHVSGQDYVA